MTTPDPRAALETVWRMEYPRIVATLARLVRDVGLAEELAQDTLVIALEQWPVTGVPAHPASWLTATAKHKAVDLLRRRSAYAAKLAEVGRSVSEVEDRDLAAELDDYVGDDMLRLIFTTCHPVLPVPSRVALTLRLLGGLSTAEIARAYLVSEATVSQRILRAKRTLAERRVPIELPPPAQASERLASVLEVVYLIFNEGYAATAGEDWTRPALCVEAMRLGRVLAGLAPAEPEVHGLVALMELQASRLPARIGPGGAPILLQDQDRRRWDRLLIRRGLAALDRAGATLGPYALQAAIAACHARAASPQDTDWARIAGLYGVLAVVSPSPVVELNRAVAVGHAHGPAAALAIVEGLELPGYALLPAVRGDLLEKLGRVAEAREAFAHAAALTHNARERDLFLARAADAGAGSTSDPAPSSGNAVVTSEPRLTDPA
ncbi:RNA polymerase sigma factor [Luedemannella helvata]|uniref:RNA polymerase sigma factor n=1 Tax=Luedemannella helvata TaxID=349315 RepID=A0ABP4W294_9ACTN